MYKVFITRKIPEAGEELLRKNGFKVSVFKKDRPITKEELFAGSRNADGIIPLLTDKIDKTVIDNMPKCRVIANYAVGYNNIDIKYAAEKNIVVTNTPGILTDATADFAMALLLSAARRIPEGGNFIREGKFSGWAPQLLLGFELKNKTAGVIGFGRIGQAFAKRISSFGANVLYYNRTKKKETEENLGAKKVSLKTLLKKSDFISVHLPLNEKTFHLLDEEEFAMMKESAIIINTARGEIINEKILIKYLKKKKIFAAALDVFENEPKVNPALFKLENAALVPHLGSATVETRDAMAVLAAENVSAVLKGKKPLTPVS